MTEEEWLTGMNCGTMIEVAVRSRLNFRRRGRAFRRFAVYVLRDLTPFAPNERFGLALDAAERFLDGAASGAEVERAIRAAETGYEQYHADGNDPAELTAQGAAAVWREHPHDGAKAALNTALHVAGVRSAEGGPGLWSERLESLSVQYAPLLRELLGNPFRPVTLAPAWLTSTAVGIARGIYDDRAFDRLPILADALQDAGCEDAEVLAHCRGDGPHVRGCWVVDGVLGKG